MRLGQVHASHEIVHANVGAATNDDALVGETLELTNKGWIHFEQLRIFVELVERFQLKQAYERFRVKDEQCAIGR